MGEPVPLTIQLHMPPAPTWQSTSWMQPKMMIHCCRVMLESGLNERFSACERTAEGAGQ